MAMTGKSRDVSRLGQDRELAAFLETVNRLPKVTGGGRGRLMIALDATMSRQPTWDRACQIQAEMFQATAEIGGLDVQMAYFRGFGDFRASPWVASPAALAAQMGGVRVAGGQTQIERVLSHALAEHKRAKVHALVYVGDAQEENPDRLCQLAGEMGLAGLRAFVFQEGDDPAASRTFAEIARLTGGAHCRFDSASARQLRDLLAAVAVYAAGGLKALRDFSARRGGDLPRLIAQVR
jgi:hypothetical protein